MILAGVILYNPDLSRLKENIEAISRQVDKVVLIDNHSENIHDVELLLSDYDNAELIKNSDNLGIARALNQEMEYAEEHGYDWVLALDQDSVASLDMVEAYRRYMDDESIGMITCNIIDRSRYINSTGLQEGYVKTCYTSGCMTRVKAWNDVGKYDEDLFIDNVDFDFCHKLIDNGYKIWKVGNKSATLLHELGRNSRTVKVFEIKVKRGMPRWHMINALSSNYPPSGTTILREMTLFMVRGMEKQ